MSPYLFTFVVCNYLNSLEYQPENCDKEKSNKNKIIEKLVKN